MTFLKSAVLAILLLIHPAVSAQREADNWFFGRGVGVSFATGKPVPVYGNPMRTPEGTTVASDSKSGKLFFYTDGVTVWTADHQIMANGKELLGSTTSTQSALVLPVPGRSGQFYLFTTRSYPDQNGGLHYSVVDMALSEGKGAVVASHKNRLLEKFGSEKLTAVPHANKRDFWLISHRWDSDVFLVYLISPAGVAAARETKIGTVHRKVPPETMGFGESIGSIKASPNGRMLGVAVYGRDRPFELYDFDSKTGTISNYRSLGNFSNQYSLSFSPDNSKLFLALIDDEGCYQFDLFHLGLPPLPIVSPDMLNNNPTYVGGSMQLGPDGKLYMASLDRVGLLVIDHPNEIISKNSLHEVRFDLKDGRIYEGLPNFLQSTFNTSPLEPYVPNITNCGEDLLVYPSPVVNNKFTVQMDSSNWRAQCQLLKFKVFFLSGIELLSTEYQINETFDVDTTSWPAGLYLLLFEYEKKRVVKKLVKI
ncbi:T9SS type A sorting domain-containing protein [Dyadobacter sp. CY323]|uniref:T9SS type A sorting domain-containing protein n=1 Tax=Dyadobacter sp. CY323 TaxID=2907302 RepID=UPI001F2290F6|nr:T9SS type A sorting domain-containing protein [Dyadobacter sp. CY323]MCE6991450.1 T9SS type A sorting domain-containing protein [Dyadobacter sp. CY323]